MADYVLSKATGERFYGKAKFLDLLVKTGRYIYEGQKVEMSKDEALQFINAKLKELEEREQNLEFLHITKTMMSESKIFKEKIDIGESDRNQYISEAVEAMNAIDEAQKTRRIRINKQSKKAKK